MKGIYNRQECFSSKYWSGLVTLGSSERTWLSSSIGTFTTRACDTAHGSLTRSRMSHTIVFQHRMGPYPLPACISHWEVSRREKEAKSFHSKGCLVKAALLALVPRNEMAV